MNNEVNCIICRLQIQKYESRFYWVCRWGIIKDGHVDVVILTAGEENEPFKAMMPHEFLEALHPEYPDGE